MYILCVGVFLHTAGSSVHAQDVSRPLHGHTPIDFGKETGFGLPTTRDKNRNQNFGQKKHCYCSDTRKEWTLYGSFLKNLEIGQILFFFNPFTDVIFRFQSTCHCNWRGQHIYQRGFFSLMKCARFCSRTLYGSFCPFCTRIYTKPTCLKK